MLLLVKSPYVVITAPLWLTLFRAKLWKNLSSKKFPSKTNQLPKLRNKKKEKKTKWKGTILNGKEIEIKVAQALNSQFVNITQYLNMTQPNDL